MPSRMQIYAERATHLMQKVVMAFQPQARRAEYGAEIRRKAFDTIMHEGRWSKSNPSGVGSTLEYTRITRQILEKVIRDHGIESMLDAGCGDFVWMPSVLERLPETFRYVGGDIVTELIERHRESAPAYEFQVIDFVVGDLPKCDLIFSRDVVQHLPIEDALKVLRNFSRSGARYLLTTTHLRRGSWRNGRNKRAGQCHDRNLLLKPFALPDPIEIFAERDPNHKFLGLWELPLQSPDGDLW